MRITKIGVTNYYDKMPRIYLRSKGNGDEQLVEREPCKTSIAERRPVANSILKTKGQ